MSCDEIVLFLENNIKVSVDQNDILMQYDYTFGWNIKDEATVS